MICPQCNADIPDNAAFCSLCYCQFAYTVTPSAQAQQYAPAYGQAPSGTIGGILGTDGMTADQLRFELVNGGKCVVFEYCISAIFVTFRRPSPAFFVKTGESTLSHSIPYTLVSLLLGWWGFPFGFIFTPSVIFNNMRGGKDVTREVIPKLNALYSQGLQGMPGPLL